MVLNWDDWTDFANQLQSFGMKIIFPNKFECTEEFLNTLPVLELQFSEAELGDVVRIEIPWQGYAE